MSVGQIENWRVIITFNIQIYGFEGFLSDPFDLFLYFPPLFMHIVFRRVRIIWILPGSGSDCTYDWSNRFPTIMHFYLKTKVI